MYTDIWLTIGTEKYFPDNDPRVESDSLKVESNFKEDNIGNGVCNINSNTKLQDCARFDGGHEDFSNDISDKTIHSPGQISKSKLILHTLLFNRVNLVLLAGIVNILLVLKFDNLFGQVCVYVCVCIKMRFYIESHLIFFIDIFIYTTKSHLIFCWYLCKQLTCIVNTYRQLLYLTCSWW